jgi:ABC-type glutathione transport system ATPase component
MQNQIMMSCKSYSRLTILFALAGVLATSGCGKSADGVIVTGTVTFDGQPVETGHITFEPQEQGVMTVAPISSGAYTIPAERPASIGKYLVRITAERSTGKTIAANPRSQEDQASVEIEQYIPEKYNLRSQLYVDISPTQSNHDFTLTSPE